MAPAKRIDAAAVQRLLAGSKEDPDPGVFRSLLGFHTGTTSIKAVHVMNDLVQCLAGRIPSHGGDFICRVIRQHHEHSADEGNGDAALRTDERLGVAYKQAYPERLGSQLITELRHAAEVVVNADGGVYRAGDRMASSLATHIGLLGKEGFRSFRVGAFLARILNAGGRKTLLSLFESDSDPVSRFLRPLFKGTTFDVVAQEDTGHIQSEFDGVLGRRLSNLLLQPLSKPALLRHFALACSLGILLKVHGVGRGQARPAILALAAATDEQRRRSLRSQAVQALVRGRDKLDQAIARMLQGDRRFRPLLETRLSSETPCIEVPRSQEGEELALSVVRAMRKHKASKRETAVYWPDEFALQLAKKSGVIWPLQARGWKQYVVLTSEHVEMLWLMFGSAGGAMEWRYFWREVRNKLGIVVGADPYDDACFLEDCGVKRCELEALKANGNQLLDQSSRRGLVRRLPDGAAEIGGRAT